MRKFKLGGLILLVLLLVAGVAAGLRVNSFSKAISGRSVLASDLEARAANSDRFNLLVLGYGGSKHDGAYLTDSILLYSVPLDGGPAIQIGVPRDLWIEHPPGSDRHWKANAAYANAVATTDDLRKAAEVASGSISAALGVPIHGWLTVDFDGFRDLVDALGGVRVDVQRTFTARYPENDDPAVSAKWINVKFEKGPQRMDGETAIRYARARYSANQAEGSDFGRAARQQRLVSAIKNKLLSQSGMLHAFGVMGGIQDEVRTNVSAGDLARIFRRGVDEKESDVLSPENVLEASRTTGGSFILVPRDRDWEALHRFVQTSLSESAAARK